MTNKQLLHYRILNQHIDGDELKNPAQVVSHLGAMQAQEYLMAKWAIGLRLDSCTDSIVEDAFNKGDILRTHLLRPTWHFVTPSDIRWMTMLTAPHVQKLNAYTYRQVSADARFLKKTADILMKVLENQNFLTREELQESLMQNQIKAEKVKLASVMMHAELEGLICSGPRRGNKFTYALMDDRAPAIKNILREEALARLSLRYFTSRGPATAKDFATWSGLNLKDASTGIQTLPGTFEEIKINEQTHYYKPRQALKTSAARTTFLMPDYDEYGMGYKDRSAIFNPDTSMSEFASRGNPVFNRMIIIDGIIGGTWQRMNREGTVELVPFQKLPDAKEKKLERAVSRYKKFMMRD